MLVKIFSGSMWEDRLLKFVEIFTKRREEFELVLTIHTGVDVDEVNIKPNSTEGMAELNQRYDPRPKCPSCSWQVTTPIRMEVMKEMFQKFVTPEQRQLDLLVKKKGGNAVIDNEQVMKELSDAEASISVPAGRERHRSTRKFELAEIQHEIREEPATAIEKNAEFFNRKFDIQRRQIQEDIDRVVRREGDRIISAVTAGPYERIFDPVRLSLGSWTSTSPSIKDLYNIWKEMVSSFDSVLVTSGLKDYRDGAVASRPDILSLP